MPMRITTRTRSFGIRLPKVDRTVFLVVLERRIGTISRHDVKVGKVELRVASKLEPHAAPEGAELRLILPTYVDLLSLTILKVVTTSFNYLLNLLVELRIEIWVLLLQPLERGLRTVGAVATLDRCSRHFNQVISVHRRHLSNFLNLLPVLSENVLV